MERILAPVAQVELKDVLNKTKQDILFNLNCVQVGTIVSFDADKNTASVRLNFQRQLANGQIIDYPVLKECPVVFLSGGKSYLSFPIKAGDSCLLLFNDRDIDTWWYTGETNVPPTPRAHSLSDAFCLVGVRPQSNPQALNDEYVDLNGGDKKIAIRNDQKSLATLIAELIDQIGAISTLPVTNGSPVTFTPSWVTQLNQIKTQFALLLEEGS